MWVIFKKEINSFFSSLVGYLAIGIFLLIIGLFTWVFTDTNILDGRYANLDQLFSIAPFIFMFLIPAITMRTFAEERQSGTIEFLLTKPLKDIQIVLGKYFASLFLVFIALIPTGLYYYSVVQLGNPVGNIDGGAILGSYIGLFFLAAVFVAIGLFASSLSSNQIVSFIVAVFLCFIMYLAFMYLSSLPIFFGSLDDVVKQIGINDHYLSMSKGKVDTRDVVYFLTVIGFFVYLTFVSLSKRRWENA